MEDSLSMILVQRIAIIAVIAYVFSHTKAFRLMFKEQTTYREKAVLIAFFSAISIAGTYFGIPIEGGIANVRDTGSIVAGLLGGPVVGVVTGLISGLHRVYIGGFSAQACGLATICGGILGGYIHRRMKPKLPDWIVGVVTGVGVILFSMGLILAICPPFPAAWALVSSVTIPMSLGNALGISVFMIIIHNAREYQTKIGALQTHKALRIANAALPYFRQGLNSVSAERVATTIRSMTSASAVAITNRDRVLAHVGLGEDHHRSGLPLLTEATKTCLATGQVTLAQDRSTVGCVQPNCQLKSAVVVPLRCRDEVVGTLKLYYAHEGAMTALDMEFAQGLGQIFGTQLELASLEQMAELAANAELKALRAQINPHFLFNALNTIVSLCRTSPEEARRLIIELSDFFRRSLKSARDFVTLKEELEHVDSYLNLEKARFGSRLTIVKELDEEVLNILIPAFTLQPLVENAIKHGLLPKEQGGTVTISAAKSGHHVEIFISDDGQGIAQPQLTQVLVNGYGKGAGVGLSNVNDRLKNLYGPQHALQIDSAEGEGTTVRFIIPANVRGSVA
ncbi:MAG: sensor histidine kinase [Negativicutes bacterium]|nr:sensor histidine kinase [Negativicutes bacterium]